MKRFRIIPLWAWAIIALSALVGCEPKQETKPLGQLAPLLQYAVQELLSRVWNVPIGW